MIVTTREILDTLDNGCIHGRGGTLCGLCRRDIAEYIRRTTTAAPLEDAGGVKKQPFIPAGDPRAQERAGISAIVRRRRDPSLRYQDPRNQEGVD